MIHKFRLLLMGLLAVMVFPLSASAATLNVLGGQLMGASGVLVDGVSYDVEFVDGTCTGLFGGCNELTDFAFNDVTSATTASLALLDQVFLDVPAGNFDTAPELTNGITDKIGGIIYTPYAFDAAGGVIAKELLNYVDGAYIGSPCFCTLMDDTGNSVVLGVGDDLGTYTYAGSDVYARWSLASTSGTGGTGSSSSVPEPSTLLLLGSALAGLGVVRRKLRK